MKKIFKLLLACILTMRVTLAEAQTPEMADVMRSEGKIYVVVAIILIVLIGLITYLFLLDRKLTRMEKQLGDKTKLKGDT